MRSPILRYSYFQVNRHAVGARHQKYFGTYNNFTGAVPLRLIHQFLILINEAWKLINQSLILVNESLILVNQSLILINQSLILVNESLILINQSLILVNESLILINQSLILVNESLILVNQSLILVNEAQKFINEALIFVYLLVWLVLGLSYLAIVFLIAKINSFGFCGNNSEFFGLAII